MSELICVVLCENGFSDMRVYPKGKVKSGTVIEVPENVYRQMKQSDPSVQLVEKRLKINKEQLAKATKQQDDIAKGKSPDVVPDAANPPPIELVELPVTPDQIVRAQEAELEAKRKTTTRRKPRVKKSTTES